MSFKEFIGFPSRAGFAEFGKLIQRMRFVFFIYLLIVLLYGLFYLVTHFFFPDVATTFFGTGFGISASASIFEDLVMFLFLTAAISIISIKISTKKPEDEIFDNRIRAIMNAQNINGDHRIFDFLKTTISKLLAYNKTVKWEVFIKNYYQAEETYRVVIKRTQVATNMCKDQNFESTSSSIKITTDARINGSYGSVKHLGYVNPKKTNELLESKYHETNELSLKAGINDIPFDTKIEQDGELGILLIYSAYSKVENDKTKPNAWSFCTASKYVENLELSFTNNLSSGGNVEFDLRRKDVDQPARDVEIRRQLSNNQTYKYSIGESLRPGDRLEFYLYKQSV